MIDEASSTQAIELGDSWVTTFNNCDRMERENRSFTPDFALVVILYQDYFVV
jgi:hypothetical protein